MTEDSVAHDSGVGLKAGFAYVNGNAVKPNLSVRQRCLNAVVVVAGCWNMLAVCLLASAVFLNMPSPYRERLRIFGIASVMVGLGISSVACPLYYILREPKAEE